MIRHAVSAVTLLWLAPAAQAGVANWTCTVTTNDGDSIVEPGETATLQFGIAFDPPLGSEYEGGLLYCFDGGMADFRGVKNWATGAVSWKVSRYLFDGSGDMTVKDDATQDLFSSGGAQDPWDTPWGTDFRSPTPFIEIYWDPKGDYSPRRVDVLADTRRISELAPEDTSYFWVDFGGTQYYNFPFDQGDAMFGFDVVPSPGCLNASLLGLAFASRRQRR